MEIENRIKSYREYVKGRYAYSTERRRIVWEDVVWPLFTDLNKPYFTLLEYHNKRNQVCENNKIVPRQISGGFASLLSKGTINHHQQKTYFINYKLIPYIKKRIDLDYETVMRAIRS